MKGGRNKCLTLPSNQKREGWALRRPGKTHPRKKVSALIGGPWGDLGERLGKGADGGGELKG